MTILVAEDDEICRDLILRALSDKGYKVYGEANGRLAWERLNRDGADIGIFDINMPEMDGLDLLRRIRTSPDFAAMPVLLLTVRLLVEDQVNGYDSGADDYLAKPFALNVLLARIKALERRLLPKSGRQP